MGQTLKPGDMVAMVLREGTAPSRCQTGKITAVDKHGVRLTLNHWALLDADGWELFVPWGSITATLIGSSERDSELFRKSAKLFVARCRSL